MDNKYLVSKNILYNFLGQAVLLLLGLFTTPFFIYKLGKDSFGILVLLTSLVGYFSILEFGFSAAIIKSITEVSAKKDYEGLKKITSTAFLVFLMIGILGALLIILSAHWIIGILHIPQNLQLTALNAFYISSLSFLVSMITVVFISIPSAFQRMDIINSRNIFLGVLNSVGSIILLMLGFHLLAVVLWNVAISALATIIFFILIRKVFPGTSFSLKFDKKVFLKLFKFGGFKFISNISGQIIFQLDRLLIGIFQPISSLTFYNPPLSLVQKSFSSLLNITGAAFPAVTQSDALGDMERIRQLYLRMSRLIAFIMFPALAIFFIGAESLMNIWLGPEFARESAPVLRIFAIAYLFIAFSAAPVVVSEGMNKPKIPAIFGSLGAIINLIAALILIPKFGITGAALALLINCVLQVPVFVWFVSKKVIKVPVFLLFKKAYLKPMIAAASAIFLSEYFFSYGQSLVSLSAAVLIFGVSYLSVNILIGTFDSADKLAAKYFISKVTKVL